MAYAITQTCCNDASCVSVCPVNCIHPTPDEPDFGSTDMLYIDPHTCIDCGACADACPVDAIFPVDRLWGADAEYAEINRDYYQGLPADNTWNEPHFPRSLPDGGTGLRVAIVGTGPAAAYTTQELLRCTDAEVTMIDRLPVPGGLVRFGVAPDHPSTKKIGDSFAWLYQHPRLRVHMNVEVGTEVTHAELAAHHHAVIYAVGAATDRTLGIAGEELAGSVSATDLVNWYNSHPEVPSDTVDLSGERTVVVGNGNVAVDVARILASDPEDLAGTDIADHALRALRSSNVREVVMLGRRGPEQAAYTPSEFRALRRLPDLRLVVDDQPGVRAAIAAAEPGSKAALLRDLPIEHVDGTTTPPDGKRIVLRFFASPVEILGDEHVHTVRVRHNSTASTGESASAAGRGALDDIRASLVLRSIGYRSTPIADLPFDTTTATVPNDSGRVADTDPGAGKAGTYVVGWVKRGPSGGIGANKTCAAETVDALLDDAGDNRLPTPTGTAKQFARLVRRRKPDAIGLRGMRAIDKTERERGHRAGRPRVKFTTVPELLAASSRLPDRR